jgi:hypothetical protein
VSEEGVARALHLSAIVVNYVGIVVEDWVVVVVVHDVGIVVEDWTIVLAAVGRFVVVHDIGVVIEDWSIILTKNIEALGRVDSIVGMAGTLAAPAPVFCGDEGEEGDQKEEGY